MALVLPDPDIGWDLERLEEPSKQPTKAPSPSPTRWPTYFPTQATERPTKGPTPEPTSKPTPAPSGEPTAKPTPRPTPAPSREPKPTPAPSREPTPKPTPAPSRELTPEPSKEPTLSSTTGPSPKPTAPEPTTFLPVPEEVPTPGTILPIPAEVLAPATLVPVPVDQATIPTPVPPDDATPTEMLVLIAPSTRSPSSKPTWYPTSDPDSPVVRTYYSCPPPASKTITAHDKNGSDVIYEIKPPVSTVKIDYDFQVQLLEDEDEEDLEYLLPRIDSRLGESLARQMWSGTENGQDEDSCRGYYIEDFRRRRNLNGVGRQARADGLDMRTKIIGISSVGDLSIEDGLDCDPKNDGCYVVRGEYDATYVGFNEAGVKSSVSRVVKEEMDEGDSNDGAYQLSFLGLANELSRSAEPGIAALNVVDYVAQVVPENNTAFTNYGIGFVTALTSAFLMLCYVIFVKGDGADKVKERMDERKEKKKEKRKALGERDEEGGTPRLDSDQSYCYDLESVAIVEGGYDDNGECGSEAGVEVQSHHSSVSGSHSSSSKSKALMTASNFSQNTGRTKRMSKRADDINYSEVQKLNSLLEADDAFDGEDGETSSSSAPSRTGPKAVSPVDAGCSVQSSYSLSRSVSNSGRTRSARSHRSKSGRDDVTNGSNSEVSGASSWSSPTTDLISFANQLFSWPGSNEDEDGSQNDRRREPVALVDRTPSLARESSRGVATPTTIDLSPQSAASSTVVRQLPSISEAELPPPMNDTPHMNVSRHRPGTGCIQPQKAPSYEECEV